MPSDAVTAGGPSRTMAPCVCCPRRCAVDRVAGGTGFCGIGAGIPLSHAGLHHGEEPPISGSRGSGTIFLAGCNLRCIFCQNWQISQEFRSAPLRMLDVAGLASEMLHLEDRGAHNINLVSPSHLTFPVADAIEAARERGLSIPVVYNSNGYDDVEALRRLRGLVDVYLPDIKYLDDALGHELSGVDDYGAVVKDALREMLDQVGLLRLDRDGIATGGLLVRHLVMPGCVANSLACLEFLASLSPDIHVSIMSQYSPQYRATGHPRIGRPLAPAEYDEVVERALDLGLENAFIQELESRDGFLPDFRDDNPFSK